MTALVIPTLVGLPLIGFAVDLLHFRRARRVPAGPQGGA